MSCPGNKVLLLLLPTGILGMMGQDHGKARLHLPSNPRSWNPRIKWFGWEGSLNSFLMGVFWGAGGEGRVNPLRTLLATLALHPGGFLLLGFILEKGKEGQQTFGMQRLCRDPTVI